MTWFLVRPTGRVAGLPSGEAAGATAAAPTSRKGRQQPLYRFGLAVGTLHGTVCVRDPAYLLKCPPAVLTTVLVERHPSLHDAGDRGKVTSPLPLLRKLL